MHHTKGNGRLELVLESELEFDNGNRLGYGTLQCDRTGDAAS